MDNVANQMLNSMTVVDVIDSINAMNEAHEVQWAPVGGIDNNLATIGLGSDPAAGLVERVTNAIDAVIDRAWMENNEPPNILSPRAASEQWFGVPKGRLSEIKGNDIRKYEDITKRVQITLQDSGQDSMPTVDIRDHGTGLRSEDFAESILGLNKNRKLRKLFLAGAFGQGGSTALAYSKWTIIASRAVSTTGKPNPVAITIVGFDSGDPEVDKHGYYKYLVNPTTNSPYEFDIPESEFPPGTLVRHISMELNKYKAMMTNLTGSLWYLVHNYLFDPVLPFTISDNREKAKSKNKGKALVRSVAGNSRRLAQGENTEYQNSVKLSFRDGDVTISWWVLKVEGENPRDRITMYTLASQPIIVTFNGQKQGDFPNTVIKNELKLPYLDRYLVVQVDCDKLDADSRRQLFPTTRESIRDTEIGDDLRRLVTETLAEDDELRRLDKERMKRLITKVDSSSVEVIRKRLANRVKVFTQASGGGKGPVISSPHEHTNIPHPKEPIPVEDPPTFIKITNSAPRMVYAGRKFTLKFETDARPDYFDHPDSFIAVTDPATFDQYTGTTRVINGYGIAYFQANEDIDVGDTANITLELRPPSSMSLSDSIDVEVVPLPESSGTGSGDSTTPNIEPIFVYPDNEFWKERGWTDQSVAEVDSNEEVVNVFISGANKHLSKLIAKAQRHGNDAVEAIKDFYLEHVAFHAVIANIDREKAEERGEDAEQASQQNERELKHACETVCGIISSMFDVLVVPMDTAQNEQAASA